MASMGVCIVRGEHRVPTDKAQKRYWVMASNRSDDAEPGRMLVALTTVTKLTPDTLLHVRECIESEFLS